MGDYLRALEKAIKNGAWRLPGALCSRYGRPPKQPLEMDRELTALVVRPDRLGDVVLSTPVYESLKKSFPKIKTVALVDKVNAGILKDNPFIDRILALDKKRPLEAVRELIGGKFDIALTLNKQFSGSASLLTLLSGSEIRVGYEHPQNAWMHNLRVLVTGEPRHEVENNLDLLKPLQASDIRDRPKIFFTDREIQKIQNLLKETKAASKRPTILIKPGARIAEWGWAFEKFQAVTQKLMESETADVFIVNGPGEEKMLDDFMRGMQAKPRLLPLLSLKELALMIRECDLLLCNHTGIMHLASAVGTPLVVIFKHGEIKRWGPWKIPNRVLEERGGDDLSPKTVQEEIKKLLARQ